MLDEQKDRQINRWIRVQNIDTYYLQYEIRLVLITLFISEKKRDQFINLLFSLCLLTWWFIRMKTVREIEKHPIRVLQFNASKLMLKIPNTLIIVRIIKSVHAVCRVQTNISSGTKAFSSLNLAVARSETQCKPYCEIIDIKATKIQVNYQLGNILKCLHIANVYIYDICALIFREEQKKEMSTQFSTAAALKYLLRAKLLIFIWRKILCRAFWFLFFFFGLFVTFSGVEAFGAVFSRHFAPNSMAFVSRHDGLNCISHLLLLLPARLFIGLVLCYQTHFHLISSTFRVMNKLNRLFFILWLFPFLSRSSTLDINRMARSFMPRV